MKTRIILPKNIADERISLFINKITDFTFFGIKLKFYLSHALFSSFDIDTGARLLLKTIAKNINFNFPAKIKDIGAGTGIIGICLKKKFPHLDVTFTDRDMLALVFTKINCDLNGIKDYKISGELGIENTELKYDFNISNIPAKIGDKALEDLVKKMQISLGLDGICAIVVIKPLEKKMREIFIKHKTLIIFEEEGRAHWVFHFKPSEGMEETDDKTDKLAPYIRDISMQKNSGFSYKMKTVYNLPDFDTLGYQSELLLELLKNEKLAGKCLFWNPIQGHIPVIIHKIFSVKITKYILAGRDLLQLKIVYDNLALNGVPGENISINHVSFIYDVTETAQNYIIIPEKIPMVNNFDILLKDLHAPNVFISDKSAYVFRLLENQRTYQIKNKIKRNGFTGVYLKSDIVL